MGEAAVEDNWIDSVYDLLSSNWLIIFNEFG